MTMRHKRITRAEALGLLKRAPLLELGRRADEMRERLHPEGIVTFVIDRNINYTNICVNKCGFCAFWRKESEGYVISEEALAKKIEETLALGGTQILLQGGLHPDLGMDYYLGLLGFIKKHFDINIHGFSPPEVCHIADRHGLTIRETLRILKDGGLDSMPGGGAEILSDKVRETLSPRKIKSSRWLRVMQEAHGLGIRSTATMMFGSVEGPEDIIEHLDAVRALQDETGGFTAFIPWTFQPGNTAYEKKILPATPVDYLRVLAVSRLYLDNIANIQASWVTQGIEFAQVALRFGANDMGSTMIEENVVRAAGVGHRASVDEIVGAVRAGGFKPAKRDTFYAILRLY